MSNKQPTAVEWLIKKITNRQNGVFDGLPHLSLDEIFEQAKELEKKQMSISWYDGGRNWDNCEKEFEDYYRETYGEGTN